MTATNSSTDLLDQASPSVFNTCLVILANSSFSASFLALALDIAMKEIEQNGHEDERMVLVFNAFDQIVPQLGVFSPLAAKLRSEFFGMRRTSLVLQLNVSLDLLDFIYSNQFTVEQVQNRTSRKRKRMACIERLSYKVLCHRLVEQHHDEKNLFENKLSDMETK